MAGTQYSGGKYHGAKEVKAHLRHDDKKKREQTKEHTNSHINPKKTIYNYSILGLSYEEKCAKYDKRIAEIDSNPNNDYRTRRSTRVTMQNMIVYLPKDLSKTDQQNWFKDVSEILVNKYGRENFIDADIHVDEIHDYVDPKTKRTETSRIHGHFSYVPEIGGKLNGKVFSERANIIDVNNQIEKMSLAKYHVHYMDGRGTKAIKESVEDLKNASVQAKQQQSNDLDIEIKAKKAELDDLSNQTDNLSLEAQERLKMANTRSQQIIDEANARAQSIIRQTKHKLEEADKICEDANTIIDSDLVQYAKTIKFKDGTDVYSRFIKEQNKRKADIRLRSARLFDIGSKEDNDKEFE